MATFVEFRDSMAMLFREAFEGRPEGQDFTWFVQNRECLFDALEKVTAAQASQTPAPGCNTIGAHMNHVKFALRLANGYARGEEPESDWEGSWAKQAFSEAEWKQLGEEIRREFGDAIAWIQSREDLPAGEVSTGALAMLPHMAFHLGAVRQLMKVVAN